MEVGNGGRLYAIGSRVPMTVARDTMGVAPSVMGADVNSPMLLVARASATTDCEAHPNLCEKPASSQSMALPIALGVSIPLVLIIGTLIFLHRRNMQRQRREEMNDAHKSLDFGLGDNPGGKSKRKSFLGREKDSGRFGRQQMSMDMNLSSPYLLPPEMQGSRESLHSLARTLHQNEDPYRPVAAFAGSDAGSVRSMPRGGADGASIYTRSSSRQDGHMSRQTLSPGPYGGPPPRQNSLPVRQNSLPQSSVTSRVTSPEPTHAKPQHIPEESVLPSLPEPAPIAKLSGFNFDEDDTLPAHPQYEREITPPAPEIQEPPAVAQKITRKPMMSPVQPSPADSGVDMGYPESEFGKHKSQEATSPPEPTITGLGLVNHPEPMSASFHVAEPVNEAQPIGSSPTRGQSLTAAGPLIEGPVEYYDYDMPQPRAEASMPHMPQDQYAEFEERGRNMQRQSRFYEEDAPQGALGVPQQDNRRLSVGFRPLPPDEIMESEDPEYRANRIRSFYKEYFDESQRPENMPPVPALPAQHQQHQGGYHQNPNYNYQQPNAGDYDDYSQNYAADAPYFDPETNAFVMPYSQPVARRAMTPPPTGQRFPGPRPPRAFHGSLAGMNMPPGRGPPMRPGSSVSNRPGGPGPRPGSGASAAYGRPRAGSAYTGSHAGSRAGSRAGAPRKPMPPPMDLNTLPTPSKLKDDSFALLNAMDFAPPENFAARARGRSQSPAGERRPYKMNVPAHSPLVNAFEELAALPSPHLLRKSSTFTGLDFAPPRKFADSDTRSETGSIRSNRSGISAVQVNAIRNGAGRVSRLPGDTVFSMNVMQDQLKPRWQQRD
ncbi:hypothetical protein B0H66DRAFT_328804 [Apodospora peruviana]|uniref:Uncharacterized protein n=1 Tax=Apodospora peruviana TaxID=516989 RepID=A0AAE0M0S0_9PEZI|nr:hypothetical protein B0H66DRAFT_328804 [Apodospora peruviana]